MLFLNAVQEGGNSLKDVCKRMLPPNEMEEKGQQYFFELARGNS